MPKKITLPEHPTCDRIINFTQQGTSESESERGSENENESESGNESGNEKQIKREKD